MSTGEQSTALKPAQQVNKALRSVLLSTFEGQPEDGRIICRHVRPMQDMLGRQAGGFFLVNLKVKLEHAVQAGWLSQAHLSKFILVMQNLGSGLRQML